MLILGSVEDLRQPFGPLLPKAYFEAVITAVTLVGSVSILGVLLTREVAGGAAAARSSRDRRDYACFRVGLFGLAAVLPLPLVAFTEAGAVVLLAVEAVLLAACSSVGDDTPRGHGDAPADRWRGLGCGEPSEPTGRPR